MLSPNPDVAEACLAFGKKIQAGGLSTAYGFRDLYFVASPIKLRIEEANVTKSLMSTSNTKWSIRLWHFLLKGRKHQQIGTRHVHTR